ncbi:hypothetical protein GCM10018952_46540 [Streptosporangium vulgare]
MCWNTPGIEPIGFGSVMPSFTNIGSTSSAGCSRVPATILRIGAVRRSLRGRATGNWAVMLSPPLPGR